MATASDRPYRSVVPGMTASGLASSAQLVEVTPLVTFQMDDTASANALVFWPNEGAPDWEVLPPVPIRADEYPSLAAIWDNEEDDDIFAPEPTI